MENLLNYTVQGPVKQKDRFNKNFFEQTAWQNNQLICGIDEVGRGCLAGPLVTAAVILPCNASLYGQRLLKDSKIMTLEERLKAYQWITKFCWYGIGIVNHRTIDADNIWHATLRAMKKVLVNLLSMTPKPHAIVIDAMPLNLGDTSYYSIPVHYFYKGEHKSSSIAAASIVAKVYRDNLMTHFDTLFPGYGIAQHKGYATPVHKHNIRAQGHSIIHRTSFLQSVYNEPTSQDGQLSILPDKQNPSDPLQP